MLESTLVLPLLAVFDPAVSQPDTTQSHERMLYGRTNAYLRRAHELADFYASGARGGPTGPDSRDVAARRMMMWASTAGREARELLTLAQVPASSADSPIIEAALTAVLIWRQAEPGGDPNATAPAASVLDRARGAARWVAAARLSGTVTFDVVGRLLTDAAPPGWVLESPARLSVPDGARLGMKYVYARDSTDGVTDCLAIAGVDGQPAEFHLSRVDRGSGAVLQEPTAMSWSALCAYLAWAHVEVHGEAPAEGPDAPSAAVPLEYLPDDRACELATTPVQGGLFTTACRVHDCDSECNYSSEDEAEQRFRCDRGQRWRFIVHHRDDCPPPIMVGLSGLYEEVSTSVQNTAIRPDSGDILVLWRYLLDGTCERLRLRVSAAGSDRLRVVVESADDRAPMEYLSATVHLH
ncbi:hypothetical protein [Amycolatopsis anabasis]|uniref:hypothetical protein n=1 Tax=Amycolatopsis anabasis TaxID=1840409 RepID=UPI00131D2B98|nr:hypothetical protein [Amycolatopsis anabasis]